VCAPTGEPGEHCIMSRCTLSRSFCSLLAVQHALRLLSSVCLATAPKAMGSSHCVLRGSCTRWLTTLSLRTASVVKWKPGHVTQALSPSLCQAHCMAQDQILVTACQVDESQGGPHSKHRRKQFVACDGPLFWLRCRGFPAVMLQRTGSEAVTAVTTDAVQLLSC
jgi:hypothetical protein